MRYNLCTAIAITGAAPSAPVVPMAERNEEELLRLAAGLESQSEHPIAQGVVRGAEQRGVRYSPPRDFQAIPGKGAQAVVDGENVKAVSPGYLREHDLRADDQRVRAVAEHGKTVVYVSIDDQVAGALALADIVLVRSDPRDATALMELARATYRKMIQNLWWAAGYNIIAIPLAAGVLYYWVPPSVAAIFMAASTVIAAINARFLTIQRGEHSPDAAATTGSTVSPSLEG